MTFGLRNVLGVVRVHAGGAPPSSVLFDWPAKTPEFVLTLYTYVSPPDARAPLALEPSRPRRVTDPPTRPARPS